MKFNKKHLVLSLVLIGVLFSCQRGTHDHNEEIEIVWIGHSCFEVRFHECRILIDPFSPERFNHILPKTIYDIVFATHKALDHYYFDGIEADTYLLACGDRNEFISERQDEGWNIRGKTIQKTADSSFSYWTVASFHDDQQGAVDGVNGIICLDFNGIKVVHLGDLGHVLEENQLEQIGSVDVLMIPVDGYFTIDIDTAKTIIRQLAPKIVFPMHYRTERSKTTGPIYTEEDIVNGFKNVKKLEQAHLVVDNQNLDQEQQIIILDYLKKEDFPILKGPYLGQKPPGMTPEVFAPEIISVDNFIESGSGFALDANMFVFQRYFPDVPISTIYTTELKDGRWTTPSPAPFNSEYDDWDFTVAPDGRTIYFTSMRPVSEGTEQSKHSNIWMTRITASGWTEPRLLEYPINTPDRGNQYASVTRDGTLYFFSGRESGFGGADIYRAKLVNGKYSEVENLGNQINSAFSDGDPYIAPDESYLIFASKRPGGFGGPLDLYISFLRTDGSWTEAINMGKDINSSGEEFCPNVTPDGKYLFFCRHHQEISGDISGDIYWVDASIIEELKPDSLK
ncbi:MAG: MBL fold metallo-hydrolase [Candidatus Aminicenantes bacterium]|nr:MAG: MBL fold metallo-hydrolase [Candidatus Aminicenantes bacterium]